MGGWVRQRSIKVQWKFVDRIICKKDFPQLKTYIDIVAAIYCCFRLPVQQSLEVERSMMENLVQQAGESHV